MINDIHTPYNQTPEQIKKAEAQFKERRKEAIKLRNRGRRCMANDDFKAYRKEYQDFRERKIQEMIFCRIPDAITRLSFFDDCIAQIYAYGKLVMSVERDASRKIPKKGDEDATD